LETEKLLKKYWIYWKGDKMDKFSIIIPAYNEEQNIPRIKKELIPVAEKLGDYEILIVNDGSKDKTEEEAKKLLSKNVRLVSHEKNMGLGAAMKTGIKESVGSVLIFLDSDFTFHPNEIPKLIQKYNEGDFDCVIGTQFGKQGKTKMQLHRKFLSKSVNLMYTAVLGRKITSMSAIFRLYKKSSLNGIEMKSNNFDLNAEIVFNMIKKKMKIVEVPVTLTTRIYGESKIDNKREIKNHLKLLSKIVKWRITG